ncbi:polysaccharide deacetylase family protein [Cohnella sp. CFH 77786]|uniref:polysaccharide deacetylase family protein n=1 Tax=Cohnella sp. CFH 77786 TaxID=2662265 RepID=UPI001C608EFB|nr:polysaccharide deacetylase family protein [Cohnella sp. CFH 77786]MBW5445704.1 polysaccharide deacetylase family protein [Cohnella sp. CFH 77786]
MKGTRTPGMGKCGVVLSFLLIVFGQAGCQPAGLWGSSELAAGAGKAAWAGEAAPAAGSAREGAPSSQDGALSVKLATAKAQPETQPETQQHPRPKTAPKPSPAEAEKPTGSAGKAEKSKVVALTFDDGPDGKYTPQVLDILKKYNVKATFFVVGKQVEKYPDVTLRIVREGHDIGNHSWSHQDLTKLTGQALDDEIDRTQEAVAQAAGGYTPDLVRAPYGAISDSLLDYLHDRKFHHVYWSVDPRDWAGTPVAAMRENIRKHVRPGSVILLHSFGGRKHAIEHTVELLPQIIEDLRKAGYEFATVDEMIDAEEANASVIK